MRPDAVRARSELQSQLPENADYVCLVRITEQCRANRLPGGLQEDWDLFFGGLRRSGGVSWENAEFDQFRAFARGVVPLPRGKSAQRSVLLSRCQIGALNARRLGPACDSSWRSHRKSERLSSDHRRRQADQPHFASAAVDLHAWLMAAHLDRPCDFRRRETKPRPNR